MVTLPVPSLLYRVALDQPVAEVHRYSVGRRGRWLLPGDLLHFLTNQDRRRMEPPFWEFGDRPTTYDGVYRDDPGATLGVLLSCGHYLFDRDLWGMLARRATQEQATAPAPTSLPPRMIPAPARRAA